MRRLGLAKKALLLALCAALAVPAMGLGWTPMTVEAAEMEEPLKSEEKLQLKKEIISYYDIKKTEIKNAGN